MSLLRSSVSGLRSFLGLYSLVTGGMALLALLLAGVIFLFFPELQATARVLLAITLLLLALFVVGAYSDVKTSVLARQTRYGTNTGVMVLAFLSIAAIVNYISADNHRRFDITAGGQYTLARQTLTVLHGLKDPVKVVGFFTRDAFAQSSREQAENLLSEYRYQSSKISFEFIDPEEKPGIARQYEVRDNGALVFESGGRRKQLFGIGEQDFTGAILNVTGVEQLKVYFLVGHGEHDTEAPAADGISLAKQGLVSDNYQVLNLSLASVDKVPDDSALLIVAGPKRPFLDRELGLLNDYLDRGGKALFLVDPNPLPELRRVLARWGVNVKEGSVVDQAVFVNPDVTTPAVQGNQYVFSQITKDLAASFFPGAAGLEISVPEPDRDHVTVQPLAITSPRSFLETDKERIAFDEGQDQRGPLPLVLTVEANKPIGQRPSQPASAEGTRLVVFADSDFITNEFFYSLGNSDFFLNSVNWLTAQQELISIRPKPPEARRLVITQQAWNFIFYSTIALLPLVVLLVGGVVWWRRR
ncbi:MAG: GldG family protein [Chloroflexi bacterium]|nr:GldG family protein [Chloroflexota bacterium]